MWKRRSLQRLNHVESASEDSEVTVVDSEDARAPLEDPDALVVAKPSRSSEDVPLVFAVAVIPLHRARSDDAWSPEPRRNDAEDSEDVIADLEDSVGSDDDTDHLEASEDSEALVSHLDPEVVEKDQRHAAASKASLDSEDQKDAAVTEDLGDLAPKDPRASQGSQKDQNVVMDAEEDSVGSEGSEGVMEYPMVMVTDPMDSAGTTALEEDSEDTIMDPVDSGVTMDLMVMVTDTMDLEDTIVEVSEVSDYSEDPVDHVN